MRAPAMIGVALLVAACGGKNPGAYEVNTAVAGASPTDQLTTEAEALWEERGDKAKLAASLAKYEQVYAANPTDRDVLIRLARGWYFYGDAYESDKDAKLAAWETSITWGKRCVALNTEFTALLEKGDETEETAVRVTTSDDMPCLYWTATALGKWGKLSGLAKTLKHIGTVKAYIGRVHETTPDYFHAATDRYYGAYYAAIPSFAGQDLNKSQEHFEKSIAAEPDYLGTQVLYADYWAVKTQNKAKFNELLNAVVAADPTKAADVIPENNAEQAKAKALLARQDELFAE